jgi:hypothetical protein
MTGTPILSSRALALGLTEKSREHFESRCFPITESGCWIWMGAIKKAKPGYGWVRSKGKSWAAHRLSWTLHRGPIPAARHVLHRCDIPLCVNPDHLFLGTAADNMRDMAQKDRPAREHRAGQLIPGRTRRGKARVSL